MSEFCPSCGKDLDWRFCPYCGKPIPPMKREEHLSPLASGNKKKFDELSGLHSDDDPDELPNPYIFNPPKPPDDLARVGQAQVKQEKLPEDKSHCQYCGAEIRSDQDYCNTCGKPVRPRRAIEKKEGDYQTSSRRIR